MRDICRRRKIWRRRCCGAKKKWLRERFAKLGWKVEAKPVNVEFKYPFGAAEVVKLFREYFGPTKVAFSRLDAAWDKAGLAADLEKNCGRVHNEGPAQRVHVKAEYFEVRARKFSRQGPESSHNNWSSF